MSLFSDSQKGPSIAELQRFVREKLDIEFGLINGEKLQGKLKWFDEFAFSVTNYKNETVTILRPAVVYYGVYKV